MISNKPHCTTTALASHQYPLSAARIILNPKAAKMGMYSDNLPYEEHFQQSLIYAVVLLCKRLHYNHFCRTLIVKNVD